MERQRGCFLYWALCRPMQQPALSRNLAAVLVPFSYRNFLHSQNRMRTLCDEEPRRSITAENAIHFFFKFNTLEGALLLWPAKIQLFANGMVQLPLPGLRKLRHALSSSSSRARSMDRKACR